MNQTNQKLNQAIKLIQDCIKSEEVDIAPDKPLYKFENAEDGVIVVDRSTINPKKSTNLSITLDDIEQKRYDDFIAEHEACQKYTGAIGVSSVELVVTHTSVGYLLTARCGKCMKEKNLTNFDNF